MWSLFSRTSAFPYEILDVISTEERSIWKLHRGKKKQNNEEVCIFVCEGSSVMLDLAKSSAKRLKMLKHPSVLKFIDSYESEKSVYLVTEVVSPLLQWVADVRNKSKQSTMSGLLAWGLLQVNSALSFMTNDAKLIHNNVNSSSIYVTEGGEWKLFGLEYTTADQSYFPNKIIPELLVYSPPEINASVKPPSNLWSADIWGFGCLIWEVFNGTFLDKSLSLQHTSKIPKSLIPTYCELVGANPMARPNPKDVIEQLMKKGQFYHNDLIDTLTYLDEIQIKGEVEKNRFFTSLPSKLDNIPDFISKNKILPALLTAHEILNIGSVLLTPIVKIGNMLEETDYQSQIVPCIVKMFSSTDRATRLKLLKEMETLSSHLDAKTINDQIFQPLVSGFQDTNPTIREHTIKAILLLAPKLNSNNLNVEALKHFARLQGKDDQGGIRTNTTVCLGKIACYLNPDTRQKCLISAFTRAMRDPFPPARVAGVTAIGATQQYFPLSDVSAKLLPALSNLTLDPEKTVRDAVFKIMKGFLGKLEKVSEDPELRAVMEKEVSISSSSASPSTWAGWAVGALTSKFYKSPVTSQVVKESGGSSTVSTSNTIETSMPSNWQEKKFAHSNPMNDRRIDEKPLRATGLMSDSSPIEVELEGDGWGDDDDIEGWGSLEEAVAQTSLEDNSRDTFPSSTSSNWKEEAPTDNFFASFENSKSKQRTGAFSNATSSWDNWDTDETKCADDPKVLREEKRLQRQKEIEAKRAARSGPMKLGTKKF